MTEVGGVENGRLPLGSRSRTRPYRWLPMVLAFVGGSVVLAGVVAAGYVRDRLVASTGESLAIVANNIAGDLDHVLYERYRELRAAVHAEALHAADTEVSTAFLLELKRASNLYLWLGVTDDDGVVIAATSDVNLGMPLRERPWFRETRTGEYVHIRDAGTSLVLSLPLGDVDGTSGAILTAHVGFGALQQVWMRTVYAMREQRGGWIEWQLVTPSGEVILDSLQRQQMETNDLAALSYRTSSSLGYFEQTHRARGVPIVTGFARTQGYREAPSLGWTVLASMDEHDILAPIHRVVRSLAAIGLGIVTPIFGLLLWSARRLRHESAEAQDAGVRATTAEMECEDRDAQLHAIVQNASDSIVTVDDRGSIDSVNLAGERVFGYATSELVGRDVSILAASGNGGGRDTDLAQHFGPRAAATGAGHEVVGRRKDGSTVPLELTVSETHLGGRCLYTGIFRDLTARKQAETMAREHQADLARVLRVSSMGEMATGLAHELNQPLTGIASFAVAGIERIRSGSREPGQLVELLERIGAEAERAGAIIHHQREFVRKGEPTLEPTSLADILRAVSRLLGAQASLHEIALRVTVPDSDLTIYADAVQIEQVLVNLVQNAIDAIRCTRGPGEVSVGASASGSGLVTVTVRDSGVGLSDDVRVRMFDAFFTTRPEGLGMGLAISRSIIEAHGGRLWATPGPAGGATFAFALPLDTEGHAHVE